MNLSYGFVANHKIYKYILCGGVYLLIYIVRNGPLFLPLTDDLYQSVLVSGGGVPFQDLVHSGVVKESFSASVCRLNCSLPL